MPAVLDVTTTVMNARIAASVLLAAYLATAAVLLPRELNFLKSVDPARRKRFIIMDLLIQLSVLAVLLPNILLPKLNLTALFIVVAGFSLLWIVAAINARSRYIYTNKILKESMQESRKHLEQLVEQKRREAAGDE